MRQEFSFHEVETSAHLAQELPAIAAIEVMRPAPKAWGITRPHRHRRFTIDEDVRPFGACALAGAAALGPLHGSSREAREQ